MCNINKHGHCTKKLNAALTSCNYTKDLKCFKTQNCKPCNAQCEDKLLNLMKKRLLKGNLKGTWRLSGIKVIKFSNK